LEKENIISDGSFLNGISDVSKNTIILTFWALNLPDTLDVSPSLNLTVNFHDQEQKCYSRQSASGSELLQNGLLKKASHKEHLKVL
jgi:hypothetical protein